MAEKSDKTSTSKSTSSKSTAAKDAAANDQQATTGAAGAETSSQQTATEAATVQPNPVSAVQPGANAPDWPQDVADPATQTNVAPAGPPPVDPADPYGAKLDTTADTTVVDPNTRAAQANANAPVGYTTVEPVPGSEGPRSQAELDAIDHK